VALIRNARNKLRRKPKRKLAVRRPENIAATKAGVPVLPGTLHASLGSGCPLRRFAAYDPAAERIIANASCRAIAAAAAERPGAPASEMLAHRNHSGFTVPRRPWGSSRRLPVVRSRAVRPGAAVSSADQPRRGMQRCRGIQQVQPAPDLPTTAVDLNPPMGQSRACRRSPPRRSARGPLTARRRLPGRRGQTSPLPH